MSRLGRAALIAMLALSHEAAAEQAGPASLDVLADRIISASETERAVLLARNDLSTIAIAEALNAAGEKARLGGGCAKAVIAFHAAETLARRIQAEPEIGRALNGRADCLFGLTDLDRALTVAHESVAFHTTHNDPRGLAEAWNTIGNIHFYRSDYDRAIEANTHTRALWTALGDRVGVGRSLNNAGNIHRAWGRYDKAVAHYDEALAIFEALGDRRRAGVVIGNLSIAYFRRGDYPKALALGIRSLASAEEQSDRAATSKALDTLANIYRAQGAYARALRTFHRSLDLRKQLADQYAVAESENNIGLVYFSQGDYARAIDAYKRGYGIAQRAGTAKGLVSESLLNIATAAWRLGQKDRARANVRAALTIAARDRWSNAAAASAMGQMSLDDVRLDEARTWFARALTEYEAVQEHAGVTESLSGLASVALAAGLTDEALGHASRATALAERYEQNELLWQAQTLRGVAQRRLGDNVAARRSFTNAIEVIERLRREVAGRPLGRERFFETKLSPYHELVGLTLDAKDVAGALAVAERAKARVLADIVQGGRTPMAAFALDDMASLVTDDSTAVFEYIVTERTASVFVLSSVNGRLTVEHHAIAVGAPALTARVRGFRDGLASRDLRIAQDARALYDLLLSPAAARLTGKSRLIVVPDGPLWQIPFQALQDRAGRYVVETAAVSYAPSLTVLRETLRTRPRREGPRTLLAMGSQLSEAEAQVEALRGLYGARSQVYVGAAATEQRFKSEAPGQRLIHIASHGVFDESSPRYSHLLLAPDRDDPGEDGLLEAWELADVKLDADLVILSACETGRGRIASGEGIVGPMWALLAAGARATVVSQWMVEASSTTRLMTSFHRRLVRGEGVTAEHLRQATLELLQDPRYRHPFYWAPFVLVGDPS